MAIILLCVCVIVVLKLQHFYDMFVWYPFWKTNIIRPEYDLGNLPEIYNNSRINSIITNNPHILFRNMTVKSNLTSVTCLYLLHT